MTELNTAERGSIIAAGLIQGLLLLLAHELIVQDQWPATSWLVRASWYAVVLAVPPALQVMIGAVPAKRLARFAAVQGTVLILLGVYIGWSVGENNDNASAVLWSFGLTVYVGWHVLLPFAQSGLATGRWRFPYPALFEHAWNNTLTFIIAGVFTGIFWGLLMLWGGLFKALKISFFLDTFTSRYFFYPVLAAVFAYAVYLGRKHVNAVMTFRHIVLTIFRGLLPLLALIALLFLAVLPLTGLAPLWATGHATILMLVLQVLVILFLNAVYQDGTGEPPYHPKLRRAIEIAVIAMPAYTLLCLYALSLRIGQHGWSVDRVWAVIVTAMVGCYLVGYSVAALRRKTSWMASMSPLNVATAMFVVALVVVVNTPLLDARKIAAHSQVNRLLAGLVTADKFDYNYLRFDLARAGNEALWELTVVKDHPHAEEIRALAQKALAKQHRYAPAATEKPTIQSAEDLKPYVQPFRQDAQLDDSFLRHLYQVRGQEMMQECISTKPCRVLSVDLNRDKQQEYVVFSCPYRYQYKAVVFARRDHHWREVGELRGSDRGCPAEIWESDTSLGAGGFQAMAAQWSNLRLGQSRLFFMDAVK